MTTSKRDRREYMKEYASRPEVAERIRNERRRHYLKHKDRILEESKIRFKENAAFRRKILSEFPCAFCGESDSDLIDWHHIDESTKKFNVGHTSRGHSDWWDEVMKCIPLCALCHRKIHKNKLCLLPHKPYPKQ